MTEMRVSGSIPSDLPVEAVSHALNRLDIYGPAGIGLQLLSQAADNRHDIAVVVAVVLFPDEFIDFLLCKIFP